MNVYGFHKESINEGEGLRYVVYISGCKHQCPGCFNPQTWNFNAGEEFTIDRQLQVIEEIKNNSLISGITLCGGDPFFSAAEVAVFIEMFREQCPDKNVWAYSGFTFKELLEDPAMGRLALLCDVIVDGKFIESEKDLSLPYRGSRNQKIINVHLKSAILGG